MRLFKRRESPEAKAAADAIIEAQLALTSEQDKDDPKRIADAMRRVEKTQRAYADALDKTTRKLRRR